jgi:aminoglycoside phosphotransferase (APT) family kinase protein
MREVTLVLCSPERVLGALPPFPVEFPFWQSVDDVVAGCLQRYGLAVVVLRLLSAPGTVNGMDGPVSYLAQPAGVEAPLGGPEPVAVEQPGPLLQPWAPVSGVPHPLVAHPLRARYAEPGGPQADLRWADDVLAELGRPRTGAPRQLRTWNLSSIWSIPTASRPVWLKVMPSFLAAEAPLLTWLGSLRPGESAPVATVLGSQAGRQLLDDVPGEDHYGAGAQVTGEAVELLVGLQAAAAPRIAELTQFAVPDRRAVTAAAAVRAVHERYRSVLTAGENRGLDALVASLADRFATVAAAGLPDTVVHGDFHPGNVRGLPGRLRLLDWGDAVTGPPVLDLIRLLNASPAEDREQLKAMWARAWRARIPGADPLAALAPMLPVAELLEAVTYRRFLDHIEPDEHPYHLDDPVTSLRAALTA